jgi:hypothetical protein
MSKIELTAKKVWHFGEPSPVQRPSSLLGHTGVEVCNQETRVEVCNQETRVRFLVGANLWVCFKKIPLPVKPGFKDFLSRGSVHFF